MHKRFYKVWMASGCCWSEDRHVYFDGKRDAYDVKFSLPAAMRLNIVSTLRKDVDFLRHHGLMDYSLCVAAPVAGQTGLSRL